MIPDPTVTPTLSVEEAAEILGLGRTKAYSEARRYLVTEGAEGLPAIRFGRALRVPTAKLLGLLGLDEIPRISVEVETPSEPSSDEEERAAVIARIYGEPGRA